MGISAKHMLWTTAIVWALAAVALILIIQPGVSAKPSLSPPVDPALLEAHVKKLSVDLYPRSFDHPDKLEKSANYVLEQFRAAGARVSVQDVVVEEMTYKNIVARFGPDEGATMVIGAHYDSHGDATSVSGPGGYSGATHTPGADDNASGVAGLLELARLLGRKAQPRPIELVAFTLEEPPYFRSEHMGSAWHARSLKAAKRDVRLMLALEMIGYFRDEPGSQSYPLPAMKYLYPDRGNFIALVGKFDDFGTTRQVKSIMAGATDLPVHSINAPRLIQGVDYSDHRSYWAEGFTAMMVTDTAFMRNPHYHRAGDTHEKLDYQRMAKVVQAVYAVTQKY